MCDLGPNILNLIKLHWIVYTSHTLYIRHQIACTNVKQFGTINGSYLDVVVVILYYQFIGCPNNFDVNPI